MRRTIFTEEHDMFRDSFRQFVAKEIAPNVEQWERDGIVPRELFAAAGASGFLGTDVPEQYGGGGVDDFRYNLIIGEEVQRGRVGWRRSRHHAPQRRLPALLHLATAPTSRSSAGCRASARAS
jgi:alkylation response protein AidB-like acyl-CoA dehydrogenase